MLITFISNLNLEKKTPHCFKAGCLVHIFIIKFLYTDLSPADNRAGDRGPRSCERSPYVVSRA